MPLTFTITLARFSARPTIAHADKAEQSANTVWDSSGWTESFGNHRMIATASTHAQNLPLRNAGLLVLLACTVGVARPAMGIVSDAMMIEDHKGSF